MSRFLAGIRWKNNDLIRMIAFTVDYTKLMLRPFPSQFGRPPRLWARVLPGSGLSGVVEIDVVGYNIPSGRSKKARMDSMLVKAIDILYSRDDTGMAKTIRLIRFEEDERKTFPGTGGL